MQLTFGGFTLPPLPLARRVTQTFARFRFFLGPFFGSFFGPPFFGAQGDFRDFPGGHGKIRGARKSRNGEKGVRARRVFFFGASKYRKRQKGRNRRFTAVKRCFSGPQATPKRPPGDPRNRATGRPGPPKTVRGRFREVRVRRRFPRNCRNAPGGQNEKKSAFLGSEKGPVCQRCAGPFSLFFSASFPTLPRGGPGAHLGPISVAFWSIRGSFRSVFPASFSTLLRQHPHEDLAKFWHKSCIKPADTLSNPPAGINS